MRSLDGVKMHLIQVTEHVIARNLSATPSTTIPGGVSTDADKDSSIRTAAIPAEIRVKCSANAD